MNNLKTSELKEYIRKILDEEKLSPEDLARRAAISKGTVYAILNEKNPTTRRAIARKIALATGREAKIEGESIVFVKAAQALGKKRRAIFQAAFEDEIDKLLSAKASSGMPLSDRETELINSYRRLPEVLQARFSDLLRSTAEMLPAKKEVR